MVPLNTQNYTRMYIYEDIVLKKERISRMNYLQIMLIFKTEDSLWVIIYKINFQYQLNERRKQIR